MALPDWIGLVGAVLYIIAYAGLATDRLTVAGRGYYAMNAVGSVLMIYSLLYRFNLASFISQTMWLAVTLVGIARARRRPPVPMPVSLADKEK